MTVAVGRIAGAIQSRKNTATPSRLLAGVPISAPKNGEGDDAAKIIAGTSHRTAASRLPSRAEEAITGPRPAVLTGHNADIRKRAVRDSQRA